MKCVPSVGALPGRLDAWVAELSTGVKYSPEVADTGVGSESAEPTGPAKQLDPVDDNTGSSSKPMEPANPAKPHNRPDERTGELSPGRTPNPADVDAGTQTQTAKPPIPAKLPETADVDKGGAVGSPDLVEPLENPDPSADDDAQAAEPVAPLATHGDADAKRKRRSTG